MLFLTKTLLIEGYDYSRLALFEAIFNLLGIKAKPPLANSIIGGRNKMYFPKSSAIVNNYIKVTISRHRISRI
jgi:hypothetical protein